MQLQVIIVFTVQILIYFPARGTESWEHGRLDWQTEQVKGSFELLGHYKRDSAFGTVGAGLPLPWWPSKHLIIRIISITHCAQQQEKWWYVPFSPTRMTRASQHCLRALWMFLSLSEKVGRWGKRSTQVPTLHQILNFLEFTTVGLDLDTVLSIYSCGICRWEIGLLWSESLKQEWSITISLSNLGCITTPLSLTQ